MGVCVCGGGRRGKGVRERGREVRLTERKTLPIFAYLLPFLVGCSEVTQGGGKLSNQIMATVCVPVIATDLHTQVKLVSLWINSHQDLKLSAPPTIPTLSLLADLPP